MAHYMELEAGQPVVCQNLSPPSGGTQHVYGYSGCSPPSAAVGGGTAVEVHQRLIQAVSAVDTPHAHAEGGREAKGRMITSQSREASRVMCWCYSFHANGGKVLHTPTNGEGSERN